MKLEATDFQKNLIIRSMRIFSNIGQGKLDYFMLELEEILHNRHFILNEIGVKDKVKIRNLFKEVQNTLDSLIDNHSEPTKIAASVQNTLNKIGNGDWELNEYDISHINSACSYHSQMGVGNLNRIEQALEFLLHKDIFDAFKIQSIHLIHQAHDLIGPSYSIDNGKVATVHQQCESISREMIEPLSMHESRRPTTLSIVKLDCISK